MTLHITSGRTSWRGPGPRVTVQEFDWDPSSKLVVIDNGEFRVDQGNGGRFTIQSRHENGTDLEHDSARIFWMEGSGAMFKRLDDSSLEMTGVILKASYYPPDFEFKPGTKTPFDSDCHEIEVCVYARCNESHLIMPYMPPEQEIRPCAVTIRIDFNPKDDK